MTVEITAPVEWRIDASNSRLVRWTLYAWIGVLGGAALLAVALLILIAVGQAAAGQYGPLALVVLFALVGGPVSLLYLWPAIRHREYRPSLHQLIPDPAVEPDESEGDRLRRAIDRRALVAAPVIGAVTIVALAILDPRLLLASALMLGIAMVGSSALTTWGRLVPEESLLEYRTTEIPLASINETRWLRLGPLHLCLVSYWRVTRTIGTPTLLAFTPEAAAAFQSFLEDTDPSTMDTRESHPAIRGTAIAIGVGCLLLVGALWFVDGLERAIAIYATIAGGLLGLLFIWSGLRLA